MLPYFHRTFEDLYGRHPVTLVDVGAKSGLNPPWRSLEPHVRLIAFEPDQRSFQELPAQGPGSRTVVPVGLYKEKVRRVLHLTRDAGDSSLLEPNRELLHRFPRPERFDVVDKVEVDLDTLDGQLRANGVYEVDFLKVDTQGSELWVLEGARETLAKGCLGVEVEVEFIPLYREQPLFPEVHAFLSGLGYELYDLRPVYWKTVAGKDAGKPKGRLTWADALYLRSEDGLREMLRRMETPEEARAKALKALSVSAIYGYFDRALDLLNDFQSFFEPTEREALRTAIDHLGNADRLPHFPGRSLLARVLHRLWRIVRPRRDAWHTVGSGAVLGNLE